MVQLYEIAGLTVQMETFGRTLHQAQPYLCAQRDKVDIYIQSDRRAVQEKNPGMSDDHAEYLASGASFYRQLPSHNGLLLHSSAVVVDGRAYLFTAPRKTGKSTHVQLWLREFGERAYILNDDKPALRKIDGKWCACGTPWSGKTGQNANQCVPVAGIALVGRDESNHIAPVPGAAAVMALLEQTVRPENPALSGKLLEMLDDLLKQVPIWKLYCNMEQAAARVAYEAMSAERENIL